MKNLLIIGARGRGREVYGIFNDVKETLGDVECIGFLDDKKDALEGFEGYPPIVSSVEEYEPKENDVFICALGDPKWRKHYAEIIEKKGGNFISLIYPTAKICRNVTIGDGCVIGSYTIISNDIKIGNHCEVLPFSVLGHDVKIGDYCHLGAYTFLGGFVELGEGVTCHPRVNVVPHKKVGDFAVLGASSVVIKNVKENTTVFGIPAKKI